MDNLVLDDYLVNDQGMRNTLLNIVGSHLRKVESGSGNLSAEIIDTTWLDIAIFCANLEKIRAETFCDSTVIALAGRNPRLTSVVLGVCTSTQSAVLHSIARLCPLLVNIEIRAVFSAETLRRFINVEPVGLRRLCVPASVIPYECMESIQKRCAHIQMGATQPKVFRFLTGLTTIRMKSFSLLNFGLEFNNLKTLILLTAACKPLSRIIVEVQALPSLRQYCCVEQYEHLVGAHALSASTDLTGHPLQELYCDTLESPDIATIKERFPSLQALGCNKCHTASTSAAFQELFDGQLKVFLCASCAWSDAICLHTRGLEVLHLSGCMYLTDKSLAYLALRNPALRVVKISKQEGYSQGVKSPTSALMHVLQRCAHIHTLENVAYKIKTSDSASEDRYSYTATPLDALLLQMLRKQYPQLKNFVCNTVV